MLESGIQASRSPASAAGRLPHGRQVAYSQRFIHYLRFEEASHLLAILADRLCAKAGCSSRRLDWGASWGPDIRARQRDRAPFRSARQRDTGEAPDSQPVCLYSIEDLERLVLAHGFVAIRTWNTPFGNVKVCSNELETGVPTHQPDPRVRAVSGGTIYWRS
jgi:hypothetical protein